MFNSDLIKTIKSKMAPNVTLNGDIYIYKYITRCLHTNTELNQEDVDWFLYHFYNNYVDITREITKFYITLSLINHSTFCGYFSQKYNNKLTKAIKERDGSDLLRLIQNPKFEEVVDNDLLNKAEQKELLDILQLEAYTANLTVKRMATNNKNIEDIEKIYRESYNELFNKIFFKKIKFSRADFQEFILITEYNPKTRHSHAYTFRLIDILSQCITNVFSYSISESNIKSIKTRFILELKMVQYSLN
jgi:hypothetical protein